MKSAISVNSPAQLNSHANLNLIDCDVHQYWNSPQDIIKYLPKALRERGIILPGIFGITNPHGVLRRDAVPASGGLPVPVPLPCVSSYSMPIMWTMPSSLVEIVYRSVFLQTPIMRLRLPAPIMIG